MEQMIKDLMKAYEAKQELSKGIDAFLADEAPLAIRLTVNGVTVRLDESPEEVELTEILLKDLVKLRYEWLEDYL